MVRLSALVLLTLILPGALLPVAAAPSPQQARLEALLAEEKSDQALALAQEWTREDPGNPEALIAYARLQGDLGQPEGALEALEAAYFLTRDPALLVEKGQVLMASGRLNDAQQALQEALHDHDGYAPAHAALARLLLEKNSSTEALAAAHVALRLDARCGPALLVLARLSWARQDYASAREWLAQAEAADPANPDTLLVGGLLCWDQGQPAEARVYYRRYAARAPGAVATWLLRRGLFAVSGTPVPDIGYYAQYSRDGAYLAFRGRGESNSITLMEVAHPDRQETIYRSQGAVQSLEWSPDSAHLLLREYEKITVQGKPQGRYTLLTVAVRHPEHPVTKVYESTYIGATSFTADGQRLLFDGYVPGAGRGLLSVPATGGSATMYLAPGRGESLTSGQWTPGGQLLVHRWAQAEKSYQLVLVTPADRSQDRVLVSHAQQFYNALVTPDGQQVLFCRRGGASWDLMAVSIRDGGAPRPMFRNLRNLIPPALSADGRHLIVFAGDQLQRFEMVGLQ